jgi:hypothetical protein
MDEAFDMARRSLHDKGQPFVVQEIIAKRSSTLLPPGNAAPMFSRGLAHGGAGAGRDAAPRLPLFVFPN